MDGGVRDIIRLRGIINIYSINSAKHEIIIYKKIIYGVT